jgi:NitT/TauT family transport system substrate-binding protein
VPLRITVSRHSAFYSPLISTIAAGFLERQGLAAEYGILAKGQRSSDLIRDGKVDIMQSAVSSNWAPLDRGESELPVHFAQINQRDGFFLVGREPDPAFAWKKLEGKPLLADHGLQPLVMLKYAVVVNGADWGRLHSIDAGAPEDMQRTFRQGDADYIHLQAPFSHQLEAEGAGHIVASVGESMPPVAFSSLCCSRSFLQTETCRTFVTAFQ